MLEDDVTAFELADVEDVAHEREKITRGLPDFVAAFLLALEVVGVVVGYLDHAADAVDRRADVVAHATKKVRLGEVRAARLVHGGLEPALVLLEGPADAQVLVQAT